MNERILFCQVHLRQLPPKYLAPIANNQEAPAGGTLDDNRRVVTGTAAAVQYLAKKEGRSRTLVEEQRAAVTTPATGEDSTQVDKSGSGAVASVSAGGTRTKTGAYRTSYT